MRNVFMKDGKLIQPVLRTLRSGRLETVRSTYGDAANDVMPTRQIGACPKSHQTFLTARCQRLARMYEFQFGKKFIERQIVFAGEFGKVIPAPQLNRRLEKRVVPKLG